VSTRKALTFVYVGYAFRYLYLLVLVPFYGRVLGAAEYGRVLAAMSLYQFVWMIAEYGFPSVGLRDIALDGSPRRAAQIYGRHTAGRCVMAMGAVLVGAIGTLASPLLRERPIFGVLATLSGVAAAFNMGWYFQGLQRFRTSVIMEIVGFSLNIVLVLALVRRREDGWIVLASLFVSSAIATTTAHVTALRTMDVPKLGWDRCFALVRESTALFAARSLAQITASSSTLLVSVFAVAKEVGWYGAADRLATAGMSLMLPANQVLIGTVAALFGSKESERAAFALVRRGLMVLTGLGGLMLAGVLLLGNIAVPVILGPEFGPSVRMLRILAFLFPLAAFVQVVEGYVLVPLRYDRIVPAVSLAGALVTIIATVVLGHLWGGDGVACARVLGYLSMSVVLVYVMGREGLIDHVFGGRWGRPPHRRDARAAGGSLKDASS
jgi:PST family polysaccharide transporter